MKRFTLGIPLLISFLVASPAISQDSVITVGDFEGDAITVVRPELPEDDYNRYLWAHMPTDNANNSRPGWASISADTAYKGNHSLKAVIDSTMNIFVHFYPYSNNEWHYMKKYVEAGTWQNDYYNKMSFWIKTPSTVRKEEIKQANFHFGTYVRGTTGGTSSAESGGGGHFYHYYNIGYDDGHWHKVIVDMHPNHERGADGALEHGEKEYPTNENGYNYWDLMTRFYVTFKNNLTSYPGTFYIDNFELYREDDEENENQVYSIHGVFNTTKNRLTVGWMRNKNEDNVIHDVRYSFSDIHSIGWDNATVAPGNSSIAPPGMGGYNGMEYSTTGIDVSGHATIYVAVKPSNSNLFKQIELPIGDSHQNPPISPSAFTVEKASVN